MLGAEGVWIGSAFLASEEADIFDHLLAIIPEFGLKVFQSPTGKDFSKLRSK